MAIGKNILPDRLIKKTSSESIKSKIRRKNIKSRENKTGNTNIMGKPSDNPKADTYDTIKMTFYIKKDLLDKLYNFSYWDRHSLTEAFNMVMADGLHAKNTKPKPERS